MQSRAATAYLVLAVEIVATRVIPHVTARPMHAAIIPIYHRYLKEKEAVDAELDDWLSTYGDQGPKSGYIPVTEARSLDDVREDQLQRFYLTKEQITEAREANPMAEFTTDGPLTLMTMDEFKQFLLNSHVSEKQEKVEAKVKKVSSLPGKGRNASVSEKSEASNHTKPLRSARDAESKRARTLAPEVDTTARRLHAPDSSQYSYTWKSYDTNSEFDASEVQRLSSQPPLQVYGASADISKGNTNQGWSFGDVSTSDSGQIADVSVLDSTFWNTWGPSGWGTTSPWWSRFSWWDNGHQPVAAQSSPSDAAEATSLTLQEEVSPAPAPDVPAPAPDVPAPAPDVPVPAPAFTAPVSVPAVLAPVSAAPVILDPVPAAHVAPVPVPAHVPVPVPPTVPAPVPAAPAVPVPGPTPVPVPASVPAVLNPAFNAPVPASGTHAVTTVATTKNNHQTAQSTTSHTPTADASESVDWSTSSCVKPPGLQGQCGSCWAFASLSAIETAQCLANGGKSAPTYSKQQLVSCEKRSFGCNGGAALYGMEYARDHGVCLESSYPYTSADTNDAASCSTSCTSTKVDITDIVRLSAGNESALIEALRKQPVVVSVVSSNPAWKQYKSGVMSSCHDKTVDHAVLAVGFDATTIKIKNSWGTEWGEDGYVRLSRSTQDMGTCGVLADMVYPKL